MAFPTIEATASSDSAGTAANHVVSLPATVSGQLFVVFFGLSVPGGGPILTWPAGWTQLHRQDNANTTLEVRYRTADGTEGATITVTSSPAGTSAHGALRISGFDTASPLSGSTSVGTSGTPDPPNHAPAGGAKDYLWLASFGMEKGLGGAAGAPAGYTIQVDRQQPANEGQRTAVASRNLTAASEDPGTFTTGSAPEVWSASTIAVAPAAGPPPPPPPAVVLRRLLVGVGL